MDIYFRALLLWRRYTELQHACVQLLYNMDTAISEAIKDMKDEEDQTRPGGHECSFFGWRPRYLQFFAKPYWFMLVLNSLTLCEGAIVSGEDCTLLCICLCSLWYVPLSPLGSGWGRVRDLTWFWTVRARRMGNSRIWHLNPNLIASQIQGIEGDLITWPSQMVEHLNKFPNTDGEGIPLIDAYNEWCLGQNL